MISRLWKGGGFMEKIIEALKKITNEENNNLGNSIFSIGKKHYFCNNK